MLTETKNTELLIPVLERQIIPWWERFGVNHLAYTAATARTFQAQSLPDQIQISTKKRCSKRVVSSQQGYYGNSVIASWPEDGQRSLRYPAMICVLRGAADFHIADYLIHCPQGHFLYFTPGVPQPDAKHPHLEGANKENRYCEVLWFVAHPGTNCVTLSICCSQGDKHWAFEYMKFRMVAHPDVLYFFNFFMNEMRGRPQNYRKTAELSFATFLQLYLRELKAKRFYLLGQHQPSTPDDMHLAASPDSPIALAKQYIQAHLNKPLTTDNVAQAIFMSRSSFIRHFQQETGQTFNEYVREQRLREAEWLLTEGNLPINSIASLVGLKPAHFRQIIKHHFGTAPSTLRKQLQK